MFHISPKEWGRQVWANSLDLDQMLQDAASDLSLHCLLLNQKYLDTLISSNTELLKSKGSYDVPIFRVTIIS